jgi:hypothetical protein
LTANDFDKAFGSNGRSTTFANRTGKPEANGEVFVGAGPYKAYGFIPAGTVNETCEVIRWVDGTEIPEGIDFPYRLLLQIAFVGEEQLKLFLPDCIVVIEGRNLRDLRRKIARRQATFIWQYSARVWPSRPPSCETLIDRIQIVRPNR